MTVNRLLPVFTLVLLGCQTAPEIEITEFHGIGSADVLRRLPTRADLMVNGVHVEVPDNLPEGLVVRFTGEKSTVTIGGGGKDANISD